MKKLLILRGIPGSGKSTYANTRTDAAIQEGYMSTTVCSADNYFVRPDKVYDFNGKKIKNAHAWCRGKVYAAMKGDTWGPSDLIVLDNTNTRHWEYKAYVELAEKHGYEVEIQVIGKFDAETVQLYAERNTHGVPVEKVIEMAERFEH